MKRIWEEEESGEENGGWEEECRYHLSPRRWNLRWGKWPHDSEVAGMWVGHCGSFLNRTRVRVKEEQKRERGAFAPPLLPKHMTGIGWGAEVAVK